MWYSSGPRVEGPLEHPRTCDDVRELHRNWLGTLSFELPAFFAKNPSCKNVLRVHCLLSTDVRSKPRAILLVADFPFKGSGVVFEALISLSVLRTCGDRQHGRNCRNEIGYQHR